MKAILKQLVPPIIKDAIKQKSSYGWFGDYKSWEEAKRDCEGYHSNTIFDKIMSAASKVKNGEALFERDGVLFFEENFNWKLLSSLLFVAARNGGVLHVTDFGGSLGSIFFQHKKMLSFLKEIKWSVVEQTHFVKLGQQTIQSSNLTFCNNISECLMLQQPQVLLLSSVIQYLDKPFEAIDQFLAYGYDYILIDRTAFTENNDHQITVQKVRPEIYAASYPAWFFNEQAFLASFLPKYEVINQFSNDDYSNKKQTYFKGFFMAKKERDGND